jgi:hypothetical protein
VEAKQRVGEQRSGGVLKVQRTWLWAAAASPGLASVGEGCGGEWGRRGRLARRSVKKLCVLAGFSKIRIQVPGKEGGAREMRFFNFDRPPSIVAGQSRIDRAEKG